MTLFEAFVLRRLVVYSRKRARQQPKRRASWVSTAKSAQRKLRRAGL